MKVYNSLSDFHTINNCIVTSGTFDGVHIGHQTILNRIKKLAEEQNGETLVLTFWPHPRLIINPHDPEIKLLTTLKEKIDFLTDFGINHLLIVPFTKEFSNLTSEQFIRQILIEKIGTKKLVIGYDHRFGKNREGSFEHLKENSHQYGFEVEEIPKQLVEHVAVSSTKIRNAIVEGDVKTAKQYLGRYYSIEGKVIHGDNIGEKLEYPTANILIEETYKLIPAEGIYACFAYYGDTPYKAMLYIGKRPTLHSGVLSVEVHLLGFHKKIYDERIKVELVQKIREDAYFENLEDLKNQIRKDEIETLKVLSLLKK